MTTFFQAPSAYPDTAHGTAVNVKAYDLRLEVNVEDSAKSVPVVKIFRQLLVQLAATAGDPIEVFDIHGSAVTAATLPSGKAEFDKAFGVESIEGKNRKVALGFKLRTSTWLSWLKSRLMKSFLQPKGLFLRIQTGGFSAGVAQDYVGFWMQQYPTHADIPVLTTVLMTDVEDYWAALPASVKTDWLTKHSDALTSTTVSSSVFHLESGRIYGENTDNKLISTGALKIMTPKKYTALARFLFDGVVVKKANQHLIPGALRYEEKETYFNLLAQQHVFMEDHRNIQIRNVTNINQTEPGLQGTTIHQVVTSSDSILRVTHDANADCINLSVHKNNYLGVLDWLTDTLPTHSFAFDPQVKRTTPARHSGSSPGSRYSGLFTEAVSITNLSFDPSTIGSRRSAWNSRPPVMISYAQEETDFPPLASPSKTNTTTPDNKSTVTSTVFDESSVQSLIQETISKLEAQHRQELDSLRVHMEAKLQAVEDKMASLAANIVEQTYKALSKDDGPLSTRKDHTALTGEVQAMDIKLDRLLDLFQKTTSQSPPRTQKRQKSTSTPPRPEPVAMDTDTSDSALSSSNSEEAERAC